MLQRRHDQLVTIAETLLEKEVLDRQEFLRIFEVEQPAPATPTATAGASAD